MTLCLGIDWVHGLGIERLQVWFTLSKLTEYSVCGIFSNTGDWTSEIKNQENATRCPRSYIRCSGAISSQYMSFRTLYWYCWPEKCHTSSMTLVTSFYFNFKVNTILHTYVLTTEKNVKKILCTSYSSGFDIFTRHVSYMLALIKPLAD